MKLIRNSICIALFLLMFTQCEEESSANISRITTYPSFEMTGDEILVTVQGDDFTDPGVVATEAGSEIPLTTTVIGSSFIVPGETQPADVQYRILDEVDSETPGIYTIVYTANNSDGFSGSTERTVFVLDGEPDPSVDLSGTYRSSTSPAATITKVADGVFFSTNVWGGGSIAVLTGYILTSDGVNLNIPQQDRENRIFGYGTRDANGTLSLKMSRPLFAPPLIDLDKIWVRQ